MSSQVIFVSAGLDKPKKRDNVLARRQQYLNYGALTLATILDNNGYDVKLFHGGHSEPEEFSNELHQNGYLNSSFPLMLSMQSLYALSWAQNFTRRVKFLSPETKIVLGGRWVIGSDPHWIKMMLPFVNEIVEGLAEDRIVRLTESQNPTYIPIQRSSAVPFVLNHHLVDGFKEFQPNVEASRGCGMGCSFCEERDVPLTPLKAPTLLARQLQEVASQYDDFQVRPYVQSSFFAPNLKWSEDFAEAVNKFERKIDWRCESRVDSIKPNSISSLASGGLKAIDLGLESASPSQILKMRKSKNPDKYLRLASELIRECRNNDVWVKVNVLLYAGETQKTYEETIAWLDDHSDCIKGVSVGPVVVFGSPKSSEGYVSKIIEDGGALVDRNQLHNTGVGHVHPSSCISSDDAEGLSLDASRRYMTQRDYFDLKSFSYYPRSYTYEAFLSDIKVNGNHNLPFVCVEG
ncbi:B12-binding domain-containing radical SAM protein [Bacterioplanoides sp.]|uniref:B12-binding domain-containing radical SAM protein n=1 Tax=Bacterioplanoides sp. TaxID=2066072 RepID=UPI003AFFD4AF